MPPPDDELLLEDELLEDELLDEELLLDEDELLEDEELVLEDEVLLEELLLDDELLELVPPQAVIAVVNRATEQYCNARLVRGVSFCTGVLLMNYCC
jgi:hypothetical protein